ncbi:hypothetical protein BV20DRAFT_88127 [Pilatotrama ljubarskyi]|nr:hypothetical protein BV20DRAFT_88127 [Pilatotrama ljubarskyi]
MSWGSRSNSKSFSSLCPARAWSLTEQRESVHFVVGACLIVAAICTIVGGWAYRKIRRRRSSQESKNTPDEAPSRRASVPAPVHPTSTLSSVPRAADTHRGRREHAAFDSGRMVRPQRSWPVRGVDYVLEEIEEARRDEPTRDTIV